MAYATIAELKARLNIESTDADRDTVLTALLSAAENAIDGVCNRPDGFVADTEASERYYAGNGKPFLRIDECISITTVSVKDSASDTTYTDWDSPTTNMAGDGDWFAFSGDPLHPSYNRTPYDALMIDPNGDYSVFVSGKFTGRGGFRPTSGISRGVPTVKVSARWGYASTVPARVKEACIAQAARWFKRGEASWSDALASGELGMLLYQQALDPDIEMMLIKSRLVRPPVG